MLLQGEYPADKVLRICIQSINGIDNSRYRSLSGRNADPEFDALLNLFTRVHEADGIAMRSRKTDAGSHLAIIFRPPADAVAEKDLRQLKALLHLDPQANEFKVVHGKFALGKTEIAILSRSMVQIMTAFAAGIETPPSDIAGIHMDKAWQSRGLEKEASRPWVHVLNGPSKPDAAFVAVHYRDYWFWIDDRDIHSKAMFNFLMILFSFTERGKQEAEAPVITVPTN
jgi:hypothetical protein